jgi:hypothetical protein
MLKHHSVKTYELAYRFSFRLGEVVGVTASSVLRAAVASSPVARRA